MTLDHQREDGDGGSFSSLLRTYGGCECSDVRDRVFALRGLANDVKLPVDYGLSSGELWEQVVQACPPEFVEDFAEPLCNALRLNSAHVQKLGPRGSTPKIEVKMRVFGTVATSISVTAGSGEPSHIFTQIDVSHTGLMDGDTLCTFAPADYSIVPAPPPLLIALRATRNSSASHPTARQSIARYRAVSLLALSDLDYTVIQLRNETIGTVPDNLEAHRKRRAHGNGPFMLSITMHDFLVIKEKYGFQLGTGLHDYDGHHKGFTRTLGIRPHRRDDDLDGESLVIAVPDPLKS